MKLNLDYKFRFYTSRINEICLHCHWLYFFFNHIEFWTMCTAIVVNLPERKLAKRNSVHCFLLFQMDTFQCIECLVSLTLSLALWSCGNKKLNQLSLHGIFKRSHFLIRNPYLNKMVLGFLTYC
jgi:hypothetical protein